MDSGERIPSPSAPLERLHTPHQRQLLKELVQLTARAAELRNNRIAYALRLPEGVQFLRSLGEFLPENERPQDQDRPVLSKKSIREVERDLEDNEVLLRATTHRMYAIEQELQRLYAPEGSSTVRTSRIKESASKPSYAEVAITEQRPLIRTVVANELRLVSSQIRTGEVRERNEVAQAAMVYEANMKRALDGAISTFDNLSGACVRELKETIFQFITENKSIEKERDFYTLVELAKVYEETVRSGALQQANPKSVSSGEHASPYLADSLARTFEQTFINLMNSLATDKTQSTWHYVLLGWQELHDAGVQTLVLREKLQVLREDKAAIIDNVYERSQKGMTSVQITPLDEVPLPDEPSVTPAPPFVFPHVEKNAQEPLGEIKDALPIILGPNERYYLAQALDNKDPSFYKDLPEESLKRIKAGRFERALLLTAEKLRERMVAESGARLQNMMKIPQDTERDKAFLRNELRRFMMDCTKEIAQEYAAVVAKRAEFTAGLFAFRGTIEESTLKVLDRKEDAHARKMLAAWLVPFMTELLTEGIKKRVLANPESLTLVLDLYAEDGTPAPRFNEEKFERQIGAILQDMSKHLATGIQEPAFVEFVRRQEAAMPRTHERTLIAGGIVPKETVAVLRTYLGSVRETGKSIAAFVPKTLRADASA